MDGGGEPGRSSSRRRRSWYGAYSSGSPAEKEETKTNIKEMSSYVHLLRSHISYVLVECFDLFFCIV